MSPRFFVALLLFLFLAGAAGAIAQTESYDDVMLVVNDRSWASREIGRFFAERRGIPERHICHIDVDTSETIDSARFLPLKWSIQGWMASQGLVDSINFIVTTKGCPLRVRTSTWDHFDTVKSWLGGQASFEDCLALINGKDSTLLLTVKTTGFPANRYFGSRKRFRRDPVSLPMYLVTRLDAYTVDQVKSYLTRAEQPAVVGDGLWVLDMEPGKDGSESYKIGNDWLRGARTALAARGLNILFNADTNYIRGQHDVIGYASWGSNDGYSGGGKAAQVGNTWLNGSIAETFVSTSGRSFMPGTGYGQSLIADWIAEGACGVKGYTDEPYLSAIAHPDILFDRYVSGFTMAESFHAASQYVAWRQVVIGDPKMKLGAMATLSAAAVDFGPVPRFTTSSDTVWLRSHVSVPIEVTGITLSGASSVDYAAVVAGGGGTTGEIRPGDSIGIILSFTPTTTTSRTAKAAVRYRRSTDPADLLLEISLSGSGAKPTVEALPSIVDFGSVSTGVPTTRSVQLRNMSSLDTATITSITVTGPAAARFAVDPVGTVSLRLVGDASTGVTLTYTPSRVARDSATLRVVGSMAGSPLLVPIVGTGATSAVEPVADLAASSLAIEVRPNPFAGETELTCLVPAGGATVAVELIDPLGRVTEIAAGRRMEAGGHRIALDGATLPAGLYLCRVTATVAGAVTSRIVPIVRR